MRFERLPSLEGLALLTPHIRTCLCLSQEAQWATSDPHWHRCRRRNAKLANRERERERVESRRKLAEQSGLGSTGLSVSLVDN